MALFADVFRWLRGSFVCVKCGREFHLSTFGFGKVVCPGCYRGEEEFIFFDDGFWLNRLMMRFMGRGGLQQKDLDPALIHELLSQPEIEVAGS